MSDRKAKPTQADREAAARLRAIWDQKLAEAKAVGAGWTQESAGADMGGITQGAVSQYLKGTIPLGYKATLAFAKFLGIQPTEIRHDLDALPRELDDEDWRDVRGIRQIAALGDGSFVDEYAETHKLRFRAASLRRQGLNPDNLFVYYGDGDSMEPRIRAGDALMFDETDVRPVDGAIYLFSGDSGLTVKRLVDYGGRWFLQADNKHDPKWRKPMPMDGKLPFIIKGRLRWIGSWEK